MKNRTRIIAIFLAIAIVLSLFAGCGTSEAEPTVAPETKVPTAAPATTEPTVAPATEAPTPAPTPTPDPRVDVIKGVTLTYKGFRNFSNPELLTDGDEIYDTINFCDVYKAEKFLDLTGDEAAGDDTHKYLGLAIFELETEVKISGYLLYGQGVGVSSHNPMYNINGFDLLVSDDGENWTIAYSIDDAREYWNEYENEDDRNISTITGHYLTHVLEDNFSEVTAKYIMFAMTEARPASSGSQGWSCSPNGWCRLSELVILGEPVSK